MDSNAIADVRNWNAAIDKLVQLTERGELVWREAHEFHGCGEDRVLLPAFVADVNDKRVLVYEYEYRWYTDADEFERKTSINIEFVRDDMSLEFRWYGDAGCRRQLLDAIRYQNAHVGEFLKSFLSS